MARIAREEQLAGQQVQLANGKRLKLADLQGTSRVVLVAGTSQQVGQCVCLDAVSCWPGQHASRCFWVPGGAPNLRSCGRANCDGC